MPRSTFSGEPAHRTGRTKLDRHAGPSRAEDLHTARRVTLPPWGDQNLEDRIPTFLETIFYDDTADAPPKRRHDA